MPISTSGYGSGYATPVALGSVAPLGYQQLTSLASAAALTVPTGARWALLQAEDADVRWRDDGSSPTASVGMLLKNGASLVYDGSLSALRLIQVSASAKVNVAYYG